MKRSSVIGTATGLVAASGAAGVAVTHRKVHRQRGQSADSAAEFGALPVRQCGSVLADDGVQLWVEQAGPADVVVAHDAPWGVPFLTTRLNQTTPPEDRGDWPADALTDSDAHQRRLRAVAEAVRPRQWYHGHHHVRYDDRVPAPWGGFDIHGLDCDGSTWDNGTVLVGADGTIVG